MEKEKGYQNEGDLVREIVEALGPLAIYQIADLVEIPLGRLASDLLRLINSQEIERRTIPGEGPVFEAPSRAPEGLADQRDTGPN